MKLLAFALAMTIASPAARADSPPSEVRLQVSVTAKGFEPGELEVPARRPVRLVFTRKTNATCTKSVVLQLDDGTKIEKELPLDRAVEIPVTFAKPGRLTYACSMDMNKGVIVVR